LLPNEGPYGTLKVSVKDNGIGIKEEDISKLFKLFGFLDSTSQMNTNGIGLGLYICQKIVNEFEGKMSVTSEF
jgi:signal transduction histidine kinase